MKTIMSVNNGTIFNTTGSASESFLVIVLAELEIIDWTRSDISNAQDCNNSSCVIEVTKSHLTLFPNQNQ